MNIVNDKINKIQEILNGLQLNDVRVILSEINDNLEYNSTVNYKKTDEYFFDVEILEYRTKLKTNDIDLFERIISKWASHGFQLNTKENNELLYCLFELIAIQLIKKVRNSLTDKYIYEVILSLIKKQKFKYIDVINEFDSYLNRLPCFTEKTESTLIINFIEYYTNKNQNNNNQ